MTPTRRLMVLPQHAIAWAALAPTPTTTSGWRRWTPSVKALPVRRSRPAQLSRPPPHLLGRSGLRELKQIASLTWRFWIPMKNKMVFILFILLFHFFHVFTVTFLYSHISQTLPPKLFLFALQVRGRMLSTTTAIIHWDEPEEPNGQVVGYRVYYTSDSTLLVNQVCACFCWTWLWL